MGILPLTVLRDSTAPFAGAATQVFGGASWGEVVVLGVMIPTFGALTGWILLQGAVPYAAAKDGLFPRCSRAWDGRGGRSSDWSRHRS